MRVATESYFNPYLSVYVADPDKPNNEAMDLEINEAQFLLSYYSTLKELLRTSQRLEIMGKNQNYSFVDNGSMGISIGMNRDLISRLQYSELKRDDFKLFPWDLEGVTRTDMRTTKLYPDGIAVSLDHKKWSPDIMSLDPRKRSTR